MAEFTCAWRMGVGGLSMTQRSSLTTPQLSGDIGSRSPWCHRRIRRHIQELSGAVQQLRLWAIGLTGWMSLVELLALGVAHLSLWRSRGLLGLLAKGALQKLKRARQPCRTRNTASDASGQASQRSVVTGRAPRADTKWYSSLAGTHVALPGTEHFPDSLISVSTADFRRVRLRPDEFDSDVNSPESLL
mmetsp:Transcript_9798/g.27364  ORF Transcript_9798/g.27364 Transcript_9798/m.27364 type:complete len:189 (+) Transcript_9798:400-966(+)